MAYIPPKHISGRQFYKPDFGYNNKSDDIRDTQLFKQFQNEVYQFIKAEEDVSWRQIIEHFKDEYDWVDIHYWVTMAVDMLDGKKVIVKKEKIPERIILKGK
jgi:hypothetical protein